jgi:hypothetical protein
MKVSVIIPCHNRGGFLKETCDSIANQTHENWEVLIINDGSTDNTEEISIEICNNDNRFRYFGKNNGGVSSARNLGLDNATGDYIQFLDSDDLLEPTKFEKSVKSNVDLCITNFEMFSNKRLAPFCKLEGEEFTYKNVLMNWDVKFCIPIHCGLFSALKMKGIRFNEELKAKEDWVFWLDFLSKNPKVLFLNEPLALYRLHSSNMCKDKSHMEENSKSVYKFIYNRLSEVHKVLFFEKVAVDFVNERSKCDFLYEKYNKEKKKRKKNNNNI